jgi:BMFP domain-containing protein YqiC
MKIVIQDNNAFKTFQEKYKDLIPLMMKGPDCLTDAEVKKTFMEMMEEMDKLMDVVHEEEEK